MERSSYFDRLVFSAERIARHADYPGKQQAVRQCIEDIEDLVLASRISIEQGEILRSVLKGAHSHAA